MASGSGSLNAGQLDVAETEVREARLPLLDARAFRDVVCGGPRGAQVGGVERAVGLQHFGEAHLDLASGLGLHAQARPAGDVLAEIVDVDVGAAAVDGDGLRGSRSGAPAATCAR